VSITFREENRLALRVRRGGPLRDRRGSETVQTGDMGNTLIRRHG
jgi:hypothetical protein